MRVSAGEQGSALLEFPTGTKGGSPQAFLSVCPDSGHGAEGEGRGDA